MTDVAIRRLLHDGLWNRFHDRQHWGTKLSISPYPPTSFTVVRNQHRLTYAYGAGQRLATVTLRFTPSQDTDRPTEWNITHSTRRDKSKFQLNNGPERSMDILMDDIVSTFLRQTSVCRSNRMQ